MDVPVNAAMLINAESTRVMSTILDMWSKRAKWYSMKRRKIGAKRYLVTSGVTIVMAIEATIGRPMIQPRLSSPEISPKSPMILFRTGSVAVIKAYGRRIWFDSDWPRHHKADHIINDSRAYKGWAYSSLCQIYRTRSRRDNSKGSSCRMALAHWLGDSFRIAVQVPKEVVDSAAPMINTSTGPEE